MADPRVTNVDLPGLKITIVTLGESSSEETVPETCSVSPS